MFKFIPTNTRFYDLFEQTADLLVQASEHFRDFLDNFSSPQQHAEEIKRLEQAADELVHQTMTLLHQSFITPFERGDIRRLIQGLDNVLDCLNAACSRIALYQVDTILPPAKELARTLAAATHQVRKAVTGIRQLPKNQDILSACIEINRLENENDQTYRSALAQLFAAGTDPLTVIKWKEIFEYIETGTDRCEEVASLVEGIVHENA